MALSDVHDGGNRDRLVLSRGRLRLLHVMTSVNLPPLVADVFSVSGAGCMDSLAGMDRNCELFLRVLVEFWLEGNAVLHPGFPKEVGDEGRSAGTGNRRLPVTVWP